MSDMLGNRRFIASLDSVATFSNFDFLYLDMRRRTNWGARLFDNRSFFITPGHRDRPSCDRRQIYRETGAHGHASAIRSPAITASTAGSGYISRSYFFPRLLRRSGLATAPDLVAFEQRDDNFPHRQHDVHRRQRGVEVLRAGVGPPLPDQRRLCARHRRTAARSAPTLDSTGASTSRSARARCWPRASTARGRKATRRTSITSAA